MDHNVDERFYLKSEKAEKLIKQLIVANIPPKGETVDTVLATRYGTQLEKQTDVGQTLCSRDYKGLRNRDNDNVVVEKISIRQATKKGFIDMNNGGGNLQVKIMDEVKIVGELEKGFKQVYQVLSPEGLSPTLDCCGGGNRQVKIYDEYEYRIRRLTPKEYGRLMGVSDEDYEKMASVNSNSQLYKQFGNSIVVDVMCAIFKNLNIEQEIEK
mgnify:CR=1 FL=1